MRPKAEDEPMVLVATYAQVSQSAVTAAMDACISMLKVRGNRSNERGSCIAMGSALPPCAVSVFVSRLGLWLLRCGRRAWSACWRRS